MFKKISSFLRKNTITGILVLAPFGAVLGIVLWAWEKISSLPELIPQQFHPKEMLGLENDFIIRAYNFGFSLLVLLAIILLVSAVGLVSRNYLGKRLLKTIASFVSRVPVLNTVYSSLEQLLDTFAKGQSKNFRRVVFVEYPRPGIYTLAFVTGERDTNPMSGTKSKMLNVYVPTTPNPTSGFYLTLPASDVKESQMSVEEALKEIISMGIVHKNE